MEYQERKKETQASLEKGNESKAAYSSSLCCLCRRSDINNSFVRLSPCACCYCKDCMIAFLARGCTRSSTMATALQCRACNVYVLSHQIIKVDNSKSEETVLASHAYQNTNTNINNNKVKASATTSKSNSKNGTSSKATKRKLPTTHGDAVTKRAQTKTHKSFEERLDDLTRFKQKNGHCLVPCMNSEGQKSRLGGWISMVRSGKTKLTLEQRQQLDALGFCWDQRKEADWKAMYAKLQEYRATYGDCLVPWEWSQDKKLSQWVHTQRKQWVKKKMKEHRKALLESIGFVFRPSADATHRKRRKLND